MGSATSNAASSDGITRNVRDNFATTARASTVDDAISIDSITPDARDDSVTNTNSSTHYGCGSAFLHAFGCDADMEEEKEKRMAAYVGEIVEEFGVTIQKTKWRFGAAIT